MKEIKSLTHRIMFEKKNSTSLVKRKPNISDS